MRILIVEDERMLREGLLDLLRGAGHEADAVGDGLAAVEKGSEIPYDLMVLDLMLPKLDGFEVCRRLRLVKPGLAILMLTARGAEDDKVKGLLTGADDYMTKPFGVKELLARIEALGRRVHGREAPRETIAAAGVEFDLGRHLAKFPDGREIALTPREAGILRVLHLNRARVVTRAEFLQQVWGLKPDTETRTVDVTIGNLRHKIEGDPAKPRIIVSVKGAGYAWGGEAAGS
jgi:DNA-binding response OmpR family regulator